MTNKEQGGSAGGWNMKMIIPENITVTGTDGSKRTNKEELREIKFKNSDEDVKLLKAIIGCNPQWVDKETMTVESLNPIKELIKQIRKEDMERVEGVLRKEIDSLYVFGHSQAVGGLYTDEKMRGHNVENASWIKKEDALEVLSIIKQAHE